MIDKLKEVILTPFNSAVKAWKEDGKKVIGTICCYVPEEIISAAGILPYRVRATGCSKNARADVLMSNFSCSFTRSCLEFALNGTYDFLDGLAASDSCGQAHRLYDNWRLTSPKSFMYFLATPRKGGDSAVSWYRDELSNLIKALEEFAGTKITAEKLEDSIQTYNETKMLLRELYELRRSEFPPVTGSESQSLVLAAMSMPKDEYNYLLREYLKQARSIDPITDYKARLMVIGSGLDDPDFINIIEEKGGLVVADVLCFGSRYLWESVEIEGEALLSLAKSYLNRTGCPRMMDQHASLLDFIKDMAKRFMVDGIIYQKLRYCDLWGGEALLLDDKMKEAGIPVLSIQREHIMSNRSQLAMRVEAFLEMIHEVI